MEWNLERCLKELDKDRLNVKVLATDGHKTISRIMDKTYKKVHCVHLFIECGRYVHGT